MTTVQKSSRRALADAIAHVLSSRAALILALVLGTLLRAWHYAGNRCLWTDEARLSLNIVQRDFRGLLQPLDDGQAAPIGFVWLLEAASELWGNSELVLRLVPFLAGLVSLPLFYLVARRLLDRAGATFSLFLFAGSAPLVYYASEVKQYSTDVAWTLLLLYVALDFEPRRPTLRQWVVLLVAGSTAVWFSLVAVLVLAGIGLNWLARCVASRSWPEVATLALLGATWLISFAVNYWWFMRPLETSVYLQEFWADGYLPWPPYPGIVASWLAGLVMTLVSFIVPDLLALPTLVLLAVGMAAQSRDRAKFALTASPLACAFFAACVHEYPFGPRLWLFVLPTLYVWLGSAVSFLMWAPALADGAPQQSWRLHCRTLMGTLAILLLLAAPAWEVAKLAIHLPGRTDVRIILRNVVANALPDDVVYVFGENTQYRYYMTRPEFAALRQHKDIAQLARTKADWQRHFSRPNFPRNGGRVWLIFGDVREKDLFFQRVFDPLGHPLIPIELDGQPLFLYDPHQPER